MWLYFTICACGLKWIVCFLLDLQTVSDLLAYVASIDAVTACDCLQKFCCCNQHDLLKGERTIFPKASEPFHACWYCLNGDCPLYYCTPMDAVCIQVSKERKQPTLGGGKAQDVVSSWTTLWTTWERKFLGERANFTVDIQRNYHKINHCFRHSYVTCFRTSYKFWWTVNKLVVIIREWKHSFAQLTLLLFTNSREKRKAILNFTKPQDSTK